MSIILTYDSAIKMSYSNFSLSVRFLETNAIKWTTTKRNSDQSQIIGSIKYATAVCDNRHSNALPFSDLAKGF